MPEAGELSLAREPGKLRVTQEPSYGDYPRSRLRGVTVGWPSTRCEYVIAVKLKVEKHLEMIVEIRVLLLYRWVGKRPRWKGNYVQSSVVCGES